MYSFFALSSGNCNVLHGHQNKYDSYLRAKDQMKKIIGFLADFFRETGWRHLCLAAAFTGLLIFLNYHFHWYRKIEALSYSFQYAWWFLIFSTVFTTGYLLASYFTKKNLLAKRRLLLLIVAAAMLFCWKMVYEPRFHFTEHPFENLYWNRVLYWPFKLTMVSLVIYLIAKSNGEPLYGLQQPKGWTATPYFFMLLLMVPLIAAASTQPDFLHTYPKLKHVQYLSDGDRPAWRYLLYELSYGSDFFTIELFFRGFLILGFVKWAGKDAILPMAMFYCTIHFGKPLGECISSFFGGIILGVVTYHTRSILGGLIVHLGIAWMMELGGHLGHLYR